MPDSEIGTRSDDGVSSLVKTFPTRGYQEEMLNESLRRNVIIALDTGAGKTHIAVLRMKRETENKSRKVSWFLAPTVALARQHHAVIAQHLPVPIGFVSGANDPDQWTDPELWRRMLNAHRVVVSTPNVLLNALRHGYILLGRDIGLLVFDEAHHAARKHAYNQVMREFYDVLPHRFIGDVDENMRPVILGLTASPIFGGDAERNFRQLEHNLDSTICAPLLFRMELEGFVHRPRVEYVIYAEPEYSLVNILPSTPPSRGLRSLRKVVASMNIEEDPWVIERRAELGRHHPGPRRNAIDQQLSAAIDKRNTFTHKVLRDFERAADEICSDLGEWATDWYIHQVCKQAFSFPHLERIEIAPVTDDDPEDIVRRSSDKVEKLVDVLLKEKAFFEAMEMDYRGLVFATRRDTVFALTEILARHPRTAHVFGIGSLVGEAGNSKRHSESFLDIARRLLRKTANETLADFRIGDLNLIVATAVAEEGIDIQACCSVVRWNMPANMVSWAQSRGRARQERSSFVLMLSDSLAFAPTMRQWEEQEYEMTTLYNTTKGLQGLCISNEDQSMNDEDAKLRFRVDQTGAILTGDSAIEHLFHFCSILPHSSLVNHAPLFDIDPPDYPLEWHTNGGQRTPHMGLYGCTIILPRVIPAKLRMFSTPRIHPTKASARRNVAFQAYLALYENNLLNPHLLPFTEPELNSEVRMLLKEVEKREGTTLVSCQMDPWRDGDGVADKRWWSTILEVEGLPPLRMLTQAAIPSFQNDGFPIIHTRDHVPFKVHDDGILARAKEFTRRFFWPTYSSRMKWDQMDFLHLFIPADESPTVWDERRAQNLDSCSPTPSEHTLFVPFSRFESCYGHVDDISLVSGTGFIGRSYQFIRTRNTPATEEEKVQLLKSYVRRGNDGAAMPKITYPLIEARSLVKRNFLKPLPHDSEGAGAVSQRPVLLLKDFTRVALISSHEAQFALWVPSIIRHVQMASTVFSMRETLFRGTMLAEMPLDLLLTAITMPVAQECSHYQRLETLGDTTLKYVVSIQLLAAHPLWHEGYLARRKDHVVSNANLAKMALHRKLYKWIIRDRFVPKKWKPMRVSDPTALLFEETSLPLPDISGITEKQKKRASVARNLSTKVLADVVEALIGAAYLHGGFTLGIECMKVFDLGLSWNTLPGCLDDMYSNTPGVDRYPSQITVVESILGYTFRRKAIVVEALTHASLQSDLATISYERMEFLGDAVLDMVVTDYLYRAPGKDYGPGNLHMIKAAAVNAHFLAMLCLRASTKLPVVMPVWSHDKGVTMMEDAQYVHLCKCLLHSSVTILKQQQATFARWDRPGGRDEIEFALSKGDAFPWSALTSLQAPKFLSDMFESLLGAVYLDSNGDLDIVRNVLRLLGHWEVLERIVEHDMDVQHPLSRLNLWAGKNHETVKCSTPQRNENKISCSVFWDDYEVVKVEDEWRGRVSHNGVRFIAAEKAVAFVEYSFAEAEGVWTCTAVVDGTVIAAVQSSDQLASDEETKREVAAKAFKILEAPVHWLAFLSAQHHFEVEYQIEDEEGAKVCSVHVDGLEAGRVERRPTKGADPVVTERELREAAAKEAIEVAERRIMATADLWEDAE
ncbi:P-loop containing nucleoside triphosphate hydrolase protein [Russula earlei]|uniref:P-loop containing nucleoside triphosphate hydrolase protein n=1 Tax=Russula earlei TaxID=71964 RepID=A0ACC0U1U6_9AGAM|nr:P-loop containing nucleoside triphosphate hydrolase protein [Russula earlei]